MIFAGVAALFVVTPGVSTALVTRNAIGGGPKAAWFTSMGINSANLMHALMSALGLSILFRQWPASFDAVRFGGAIYITYLGLKSVWRSVHPVSATTMTDGATGVTVAGLPRFAEGVTTNLLNPPAAMFYLTYVPQFIRPGEPYFETYMMLAILHITISLTWLAFYGASIGRLGKALARPRVRRGVEAVTGAALIALAVQVAMGNR